MKLIKIDEKLLAQTLKESKQLKQFNELEAKQLVREQFNPAIKKAAKRINEEGEKEFDPEKFEKPVEETTETKEGEYNDTPMDEAEGMEDSDKQIKEADEVCPTCNCAPCECNETEGEPEVLLDMEEVETMVDEMANDDEEIEEAIEPKVDEPTVVESDDVEDIDVMEEEEQLMKEVDSMLADEEPVAEEAPEEVKDVMKEFEEEPVVKEADEDKKEQAYESNKRKAIKSKFAQIVKENTRLKLGLAQISKNVNEANLDRTKNQLISALWKMPLTKEQKYTIAEHFDKAKSVDQVKMIYDMIKEAVMAKRQINKVFGKQKAKSFQSIKETVEAKSGKKPIQESEMVSYFSKLVNEKYY
jgi:hypothetical protein